MSRHRDWHIDDEIIIDVVEMAHPRIRRRIGSECGTLHSKRGYVVGLLCLALGKSSASMVELMKLIMRMPWKCIHEGHRQKAK